MESSRVTCTAGTVPPLHFFFVFTLLLLTAPAESIPLPLPPPPPLPALEVRKAFFSFRVSQEAELLLERKRNFPPPAASLPLPFEPGFAAASAVRRASPPGTAVRTNFSMESAQRQRPQYRAHCEAVNPLPGSRRIALAPGRNIEREQLNQ